MTDATIDGAWKTTLTTPMGPQESTAYFETDGSVLRGKMVAADGTMAFTGTVSGADLHFKLAVEKPMKLTLTYDIQVEGDKLTGTVKLGMFGSGKLSGERL